MFCTGQSIFAKGSLVYVLNNYQVSVVDVIDLDVFFGCRERTSRPAPLVSGSRTKQRKIP